MIQIRPVSDLRNKFTEIERIVSNGEPIYLTKNGYGTMVVMSLEKYTEITSDTETKEKVDVLANVVKGVAYKSQNSPKL